VALLISISTLLSLFLIDKFSRTDDPLYFFYVSIIYLTGILLAALILNIVLKIVGKFNEKLSAYILAFSFVNTIVLTISCSKNMSEIYFIILSSNIFMCMSIGLVLYQKR